MSILDVNPAQMASFASQVSFLKQMCDQCLIGVGGCRGCIEFCPHPEAWPEEIVDYQGDKDGDIAKLEAFAWPEEGGKMPGYIRVYDKEGNKKLQQPVIISLPAKY